MLTAGGGLGGFLGNPKGQFQNQKRGYFGGNEFTGYLHFSNTPAIRFQ
jgi:hypothetical protein